MAFSIAKVRDRVVPATVDVAGQSIELVYRPGSISAAMVKAIEVETQDFDSDAQKVKAQIDYTVAFLLAVVVSWDIAEDDDSPNLPVSKDTIDLLGPEVCGEIVAAITEDYRERPKG